MTQWLRTTGINNTDGVPDIVNRHMLINNVVANALIDTGSTLSYINQNVAIANRFPRGNESNKIDFGKPESVFKIKKFSNTIRLQNRTYCNAKLHVLRDLLTDVIVGQSCMITFNLILVVRDLRCVLTR